MLGVYVVRHQDFILPAFVEEMLNEVHPLSVVGKVNLSQLVVRVFDAEQVKLTIGTELCKISQESRILDCSYEIKQYWYNTEIKRYW